MLIHFLNDYKVLGRQGDKIRIKGVFPGIKEEELVFLNMELTNEDNTYRIEQIEYSVEEMNTFKAIVALEDFGLV